MSLDFFVNFFFILIWIRLFFFVFIFSCFHTIFNRMSILTIRFWCFDSRHKPAAVKFNRCISNTFMARSKFMNLDSVNFFWELFYKLKAIYTWIEKILSSEFETDALCRWADSVHDFNRIWCGSVYICLLCLKKNINVRCYLYVHCSFWFLWKWASSSYWWQLSDMKIKKIKKRNGKNNKMPRKHS